MAKKRKGSLIKSMTAKKPKPVIARDNATGALGGLAQGLYGGPDANMGAPTIDQSGMQTWLGNGPGGDPNQQSAEELAHKTAIGQGPSAASAMLQQNANQGAAQSAALASSAPGADQAASRRQAMMTGANLSSQAGGQAATARAQEQLGGEALYGHLAGESRGQDIQSAGLVGQQALGQGQLQEQQNQTNAQSSAFGANQAGGFMQSMMGLASGVGGFLQGLDAPAGGGEGEKGGSELHLVEPGKPEGKGSHWIMREEPDFVLMKNVRSGELRKIATLPLSPEEHKQALAPHGAGPIGGKGEIPPGARPGVQEVKSEPAMAGDLNLADSRPLPEHQGLYYGGMADQPMLAAADAPIGLTSFLSDDPSKSAPSGSQLPGDEAGNLNLGGQGKSDSGSGGGSGDMMKKAESLAPLLMAADAPIDNSDAIGPRDITGEDQGAPSLGASQGWAPKPQNESAAMPHANFSERNSDIDDVVKEGQDRDSSFVPGYEDQIASMQKGLAFDTPQSRNQNSGATNPDSTQHDSSMPEEHRSFLNTLGKFLQFGAGGYTNPKAASEALFKKREVRATNRIKPNTPGQPAPVDPYAADNAENPAYKAESAYANSPRISQDEGFAIVEEDRYPNVKQGENSQHRVAGSIPQDFISERRSSTANTTGVGDRAREEGARFKNGRVEGGEVYSSFNNRPINTPQNDPWNVAKASGMADVPTNRGASSSSRRAAPIVSEDEGFSLPSDQHRMKTASNTQRAPSYDSMIVEQEPVPEIPHNKLTAQMIMEMTREQRKIMSSPRHQMPETKMSARPQTATETPKFSPNPYDNEEAFARSDLAKDTDYYFPQAGAGTGNRPVWYSGDDSQSLIPFDPNEPAPPKAEDEGMDFPLKKNVDKGVEKNWNEAAPRSRYETIGADMPIGKMFGKRRKVKR